MNVLQTINLKRYYGCKLNITCTLITKPVIVWIDELIRNLESKTSTNVLVLLKHTCMEFKQTIVMMIHNNKTASRMVQIENGKIVG